jgi:predicted CXXCH cytochrome family protein
MKTICMHQDAASQRGRRLFGLAAAMMLALAAAPAAAQTHVVNTVHNLSPQVAQPTGVCVFCHTPHNANPTRALWNRELPAVTYQLYSSATLKAQLDQPTGSSRLCLSCHDGILAMGNLRVPPPGGQLALGPLTGQASLGSDLSDDHPVSFTYDSLLALNRGDLVDPLALPASVKLEDGQLQCTSCHDPHEDQLPKFLRADNRFGALCTACHRPAHWNGSSHATSAAAWNGSGTDPWQGGAYTTVAENACYSCHRSHAAQHAQWLMAQAAEPANCTVCHNGAVAGKNVEAEFEGKPFSHPIDSSQWAHEPGEDPSLMPRHVTCVDCHNPHAATGTPGAPPAISGALAGVSGLTLAGMPVAEASFEYEVCSKCHGVTEPATLGIVRQGTTRNIRLRIDPANPSYHPIAAAGRDPSILGLQPGYTASSIITCTSCHNNDDWLQGGTAPSGPHGSRYEGILGSQYETNDPTTESPATYALCYECHNRDFLLTDQAGTFGHAIHVVTANAPCAACHDPHGSRQSPRLIDFMLRDRTGKQVVTPSSSGRLEYLVTGPGSGSCYLTCHGVDHNPMSYP